MSQLTIEQAFEAAFGHHMAGRFPEAEHIYRQILARQPGHFDSLYHLAAMAQQLGRFEIAAELLRRSIALRPGNAEAYLNLGAALRATGSLDKAIEACRRAIELRPNYFEAHTHLAALLFQNGKVEESLLEFRNALGIRPNSPDALTNLGKVLQTSGKLEEAQALYRQALLADPKYPEAHNNLGSCLKAKGQLFEAMVEYRRAIALRPNYAGAMSNLGELLRETGQVDEAIAMHRQAIALKPNDGGTYSNLGLALSDKGELDEALNAHSRAVALLPQSPDAYNNFGNTLKDSARIDEAIAAYRQAIALKPDSPDAYSNLGNTLKDAGRIDEAIAAYKDALPLSADSPVAHSNLLLVLHYSARCEPQFIAEEHRRWNRQHAEPLARFAQPHTNDPNPDRRLRIGYVSPDFRSHAVAPMVLPLLACHDRKQVEVFCYAQVPIPDRMTARCRANADQWRSTVGLSDEQFASLVREDRIDIHVDLAGHSASNRLLVFARKPAPVQVTRQGYPNTTGMTAIDYRMSDAYADPPGLSDTLHSEIMVRLPQSNWIYEPPENCPEAQHGPEGEVITFGCFNNFAKVTEPMLEIWAQILKRVPRSRLMLKAAGLSSIITQQRVRKLFRSHGLESDRVEIVGYQQSELSHLALYNRMSIALDAFPYHGTTTTCEALWMGVPVVTLAGQTHVARVGVSLLTNIGLPELIALTTDEYIQIAVALANDPARLDSLHSTMRDRMRNSPVMNPAQFARNIESAYRTLWRNWCEGQKPASNT